MFLRSQIMHGALDFHLTKAIHRQLVGYICMHTYVICIFVISIEEVRATLLRSKKKQILQMYFVIVVVEMIKSVLFCRARNGCVLERVVSLEISLDSPSASRMEWK